MEAIHGLLVELKLSWSSDDLPIKEKVMKLKSFVKYVRDDQSSPLLEDDMDDLLMTISTEDFTSKRLRLELAHEFRRPDPIVDMIKMEETFLVRRALSFPWLYEEGRSDMTDPELLMRSIFPIVAYTTRHRVVKQLGRYLKNEELSQQIYSEVEETYGSICATEMLQACGPDFIREKLIDRFSNHRLMPSDQVLRRIALKDHTIVMDYIKAVFSEIRDKLYEHEKLIQRRKGGYHKTLRYLWENCPAEVWKLYEMFDTRILPKMTWQAAKKLFKTDRKLIIDAKKFAALIPEKRRRHVAKYLRSVFQSFYTALFPEEIEHFPEEIPFLFEWLQQLPRLKKFTILNTSFRENYRCDILGVPEFISPEIMEILPLGHREQVAKMKVDAGDVSKFGDPEFHETKRHMEAYWYSFMGIKKSLPKLKEILLEEIEMKIRTEVAELLVYTCFINERDLDSLVFVCRLIASKWIHGHTHIRERFLKAIEQKFGFRKINRDQVWEALEDFIKLAKANHEAPPKALLEGIIEYHLKTHQPIDAFVTVMVSPEYTHKYGAPDWDFLKHHPELHREFLRHATDVICTTFPWEEVHVHNEPDEHSHWMRLGVVTLCETFSKWNTRNRKLAKNERLTVTEFPWLVCRLREILTAEYIDQLVCQVQIRQRIVEALKTDPEVKAGYFKEYVESCPLAPVLLHYLRTDPKEIRYHIQSIVPFILRLDEKLFKTYRSFFVQIKTQGFPHFEASIVETCLEIAQDETASWTERRNAILVLTYLWDAKSYLNLVSLFYPDDSELVLLGESAHMDYRIRTAVVQSLSQVSTCSQYISDTFGCILKFCVLEDYIESSVGPLTSLCLHAPLREAIKFLKEDLLDRDISIKKHAIRLVCQIYDRTEDYQELLAYLWENETHHTIKETVLFSMFEFLGERPTAENWGFLKGALNSLTADDKELLQQFYSLNSVVHVPADFLPDYFLTCLEKFPDLGNKTGKSVEVEFKAGTFEMATRFINYLPIEFIDHLLEIYLFEIKEPELVQLKAIDLAVAYCLTLNRSLPQAGDVFKGTFTKLNPQEKWNYSKQSKRIKDLWIRAPSTNFPSRQSLFQFVDALCYQSFKKLAIHGAPILVPQSAREVYKYISDIIELYFNKQDTFTPWFYLKCARIFCPVQFHFSSCEGKVRTKEVREEGFRLLTDAGMRFQKLVDDQIKSYGSFVLGFMVEKVLSFFQDVIKEEEPLFQKERVIFFIDGLLKPVGDNGLKTSISQANQILAIELMPSSSPQCMYYKRKYAECQDSINKLCGRTTRIFLCDRYSTRF